MSDRYWRDRDVAHHCGAFIDEHIFHEGRLVCPGHDNYDELEARAI